MATALKLKTDIKKFEAAIKSKATPKEYIPKLKTQLEKAKNELERVQSASKPTKPSASVSNANTSTLKKLQDLIKKNKKFADYRGSKVDLKKDAGEGAFAKGRRVSKGLKSNQFGDAKENKGNVYYEYRVNRLDVKQPKKKQRYPKLEKGGYMADGGKLAAGVYRVGKPTKVSPMLYEQKIVEIFENGDISTASDYGRKLSDFKSQKYPIITREKLEEQYKMASGGMMAKGGGIGEIYTKMYRDTHQEKQFNKRIDKKRELDNYATKNKITIDNNNIIYVDGEKIGYINKINQKTGQQKTNWDFVKFADGGYMAKGGEIQPYIMWVSKDGNEREMYGEYKSHRAAKMAMDKVWKSGLDFMEIGIKPKSMYEKEGFYKDGGETEEEPKVIRGFSDDEPYEYAKGGITEHGLRIGDMIFESEENSVWVKNGGDEFMVNLNDGSRKKMEGKYRMSKSEMAHGGELHRTQQ